MIRSDVPQALGGLVLAVPGLPGPAAQTLFSLIVSDEKNMLCIIAAAAAVTTAATVTTVAFFQPRLGGFILAGPGLPGPKAEAPFWDLG